MEEKVDRLSGFVPATSPTSGCRPKPPFWNRQLGGGSGCYDAPRGQSRARVCCVQARCVSTFKHPPVHVRLSARNQNLVNVETENPYPKPLMELLGYYNNVSTGCSCTLLCEMKAYARARRRLTNKK
ncbi:hypothetical protein ALC60_13855 [Trachymyrmex zeteki]|uniref:Uncharacterized protein n=1 Tax=Mycetomoellerius zeteki TaxID=64791 RepID=A0A151WGY6_9HYME|nr:hypothetical protein ALC60_13855 [Trachymyrmex zeteki]